MQEQSESIDGLEIQATLAMNDGSGKYTEVAVKGQELWVIKDDAGHIGIAVHGRLLNNAAIPAGVTIMLTMDSLREVLDGILELATQLGASKEVHLWARETR